MIQSIQFDKSMWTKAEVIEWLYHHGIYPEKPIVNGLNHYRVRLLDYHPCKRLRNKKLTKHGIIFTFCIR